MQAELSPTIRRRVMELPEFLKLLFAALNREGIKPCVLRNYEGFPAENLGSDIDLLIRPSELPHAYRALAGVPGIEITGFTERPYVASFYLAGVSAVPGGRSLQVDFDLSLSWKGLPYLPVEALLQSAIPRYAGGLDFVVPLPAHEAIVSLLTSLLVAGRLKEKYLPRVQETFLAETFDVVAALSPQFGRKPSTQLVEAVISGDRRRILSHVRPLRNQLIMRNLHRRPMSSMRNVVRHYATEFAIRFSSANVEAVCILDSSGQAAHRLDEQLLPLLWSAAKVVGIPRTFLKFSTRNPHPQPSNEAQSERECKSHVSKSKAILWLIGEWRGRFLGKENLTLKIHSGTIYSALVDPDRFCPRMSGWFAHLVRWLLPANDLWLLLDQPAAASESQYANLSAETQSMQETRYISFLSKKKYMILQPEILGDRLIEHAYAAIIDTLVQRSMKRLRKRF